MTYIIFPGRPVSTGRTLTEGITDPASGEYLALTDELLETDTVISESEYTEALLRSNDEYEKIAQL